MKQYQTLIFDLDDTLIDNEMSMRYAFVIVTNYLFIKFSETLFQNFKNFDRTYWSYWKSGKLKIPDSIQTDEERVTYLRANRFLLFFKDRKLTYEDAVIVNSLYTSMLGVNIIEIEDAKKILEYLKRKYEIVIATNGPQKGAFDKLEKAHLSSYVTNVLSSEEIGGYSKPRQEFFNALYERCHNKDRQKMLLIGDSLTTDVLGGMQQGIDTCWFNPKKEPLPREYQPTMSIQKLYELKYKL